MGIKKTRNEMYYQAFSKNVAKAAELEEVETDQIKKLVFYGIKRIVNNDKPKTYDEVGLDFSTIDFVKMSIGKLTPHEFMTVFPIKKDFDGEKWAMKDYFSTMKYIEKIGLHNKIGENASEFLMEYHNRDVMMFIVRSFSTLSDLRRFEGKQGIMEEWAQMNGIEMFTMRTDATNGRTSGVKKSFPSYLKLVK